MNRFQKKKKDTLLIANINNIINIKSTRLVRILFWINSKNKQNNVMNKGTTIYDLCILHTTVIK